MKIILFLVTVFISGSVLANSALEQKVKELEARIEMLEKRNASQTDASSGLKVKDMGNQNMQSGNRGISSQQGPSITPEQQKEIMDAIDLYKKKQKESQKLLDELMNEP